ncbi:MAG TPA: hypothetical protein PLS90_16190, partial [Candidatus Sumerlaeota bacterium]|nr:hypothetical protein [Candidatus Sumerlaeota bacterium]
MAGESISWKTYLAGRAPATPPIVDDVFAILQGGTDVKKLRWEDLVRGVANYCEDTGAANALVIASATNYAAYFAGLPFLVKVANTNTGPATLNINNLGAKTIKKNGSAALGAGDLVVGQLIRVAYDGTNFQLLSPPASDLQYAVTTGADNAYAIALDPAPGAYSEGMSVIIKANHTNTGAATLAVGELGAKPIKKHGSAALKANDIRDGQVVYLTYDGTNFQLISSLALDLQYAVATGADNAYEIELTPAADAYLAGMLILFKANFDNTAAATLAINGMAAKAIKKSGSVALDAGDIKN